MTELLFREDPYTKSCNAIITAINDRGGVELDRTVFYPTGGGQPGDRGTLTPVSYTHLTLPTTPYV